MNKFTKNRSHIRGNLGSKMGLIRKRAKISFCELEFKNQYNFNKNKSTIMVELTYLSLKKTTFFVRIFDISPCVFTQISIGRACWMRNQIPHPTSSPDRKLSKNTGRYVENTNKKVIFFFSSSKINKYYFIILTIILLFSLGGPF